MKKKSLLILIVMPLFLSGCWDSTELNDIAVVTGMAVDPGKDARFRLTLEYVNPNAFSKQSSAQGAPVSTMSLEGDSIPELFREMNIGVSRKIILSHTRVLFINEEIAREGLIRFLDALERSPHFRNDFSILVTRGTKAGEFSSVNNPIERIPSIKIQRQLEAFIEEWGGVPRVRLTDFLSALTSTGRSGITSTIVLDGDPEKAKNADSNMSIEREAMVLVGGAAVFKKDKLVGFLTLDDTKNYLWTKDLQKTSISFSCQGPDSEEMTEFADIYVNNNKTKLKTEYRDNWPILKLEVYSEGRLAGIQCNEDLTKVQTYNKLEKLASDYIDKNITDTIEKVQSEFGTDIFGFGEVLNRHNPKKFKEVEDKWDEEFSRAEVEVSVTLQIRRSGMENKSYLTDMP